MMATAGHIDDDPDIDFFDYEAAIASHLARSDNHRNEGSIDEDTTRNVKDKEDLSFIPLNVDEEKKQKNGLDKNEDFIETDMDIAKGIQYYDADFVNDITTEDTYLQPNDSVHDESINICDKNIAMELQEDEDSLADQQSEQIAQALYEEETVAAAGNTVFDNKTPAESDVEFAKRLQMEEDEALAQMLDANPSPAKPMYNPDKFSHRRNFQRDLFTPKKDHKTQQEQSDIDLAKKLQMEEDEALAQTMQQENGNDNKGRAYRTRAYGLDENDEWEDVDDLEEEAFGTVTLTPNGLQVRRRAQRQNRGARRGRGRWRIDANVPGHLARQLQSRVGDFGEDDYDMLLMLAEQLGDVKQEGMRDGDIGRLPTVKVKETLKDTEESDCKVCFDALEVGQDVRILPCCHRFHVDCIDKWLKTKASCPVCQLSIKDELHGASPS